MNPLFKSFLSITLLFGFSGCGELSTKKQSTVSVNKFIDGDTLVLTSQGSATQKVSLAYIDAPEYEQPYGREARKALEAFLENKSIELQDTPNSELVILADGESVNEYMVRQGYAWPQKSLSDPNLATRYNQLQQQATEKLIGIWSLEHALRVPPWVWREQAKEPSPSMRSMSYQRMRQQQELARQAQIRKQHEQQKKQK